jgi:hypothetical protein
MLASLVLAGVLAQFCLSVTAGEDIWRMIIVGYEGSLTIPNAGTTVVPQRQDDDEPCTLRIAAADQLPHSSNLLQHTWNRLIKEFIGAVRDGDLAHSDHPISRWPPNCPASAACATALI